MDFSVDFMGKLQGGADGCMNFDDPDNNGIISCLTNFGFVNLYNSVCDKISLADFFVMASEAAIARTHDSYNHRDRFKRGNLLDTFMNLFRAGRVTRTECKEAIGKLPDPEAGCKGPKSVEEVFTKNIFGKLPADIAWRYGAALMGVHSLGGSHKKNSGVDGLWGTALESDLFTNDFY
jgi:hypothetical protein